MNALICIPGFEINADWEQATYTVTSDYPQVLAALKSRKKVSKAVVAAKLGDDNLGNWVEQFKVASPQTIIFAQFTRSEFDDVCLQQLLIAGVDSFVIDMPSMMTVEQIYTRLTGAVSLHSVTFGQVSLVDQVICAGSKSVKCTKKEATVLRLLMIGRGKPLCRDRLLGIMGYTLNTKTHTLETHIYRLRRKMAMCGMDGLIENVPGRNSGYRIALS